MASRVNTKFVVLLAGALLVLFAGVAGLAVMAQLRSGDRLITKGDEAMATGDYVEAAKMYARAVNKDQSRLDWLRKWESALLETTPETPAAYKKSYQEYYLGLLNRIAVLNPTDPEPQLALVREISKSFGSSLSAIQQLETMAADRAKQLDPNDPKTKQVLAYQGRAIVEEMLRIDVDRERTELAQRLLEDAVEANPQDWESALALVKHQYAKVERARRDFRPDDIETQTKAFQEKLADLVANYSEYPEIPLFKFRIDVMEAQRAAVTIEAKRDARDALAENARRTLDDISDTDPQLFTPSALGQTSQLLGRYLDEEALDKMLALFERVAEARPNNADVLMHLGQTYASRDQWARGYDVFQRVVDLPSRKLSFEGMLLPDYRRSAIQAQVDLLLAQYESSEDDAARAEFLAKAKEHRDRLAAVTDVNSELDLKLRDAQIALIENDNARAIILLDDIRRNLREENPRVIRLLAYALQRQGNLGEAVRQYDRIVSTGQHTPRDLVSMGDIYLQLEDAEQALHAFRQALRMDPSFEYAQRRIDAILQAKGETGDETLDPIVKALLTARDLSGEGDVDGSIRVLEQALAGAPSDIRLVRELVQRDVTAGNRDKAIERVEAALQHRPDNRDLKSLHSQLTIEDPVELARTLIAEMNLSPVQEAIQLYYTFQRLGLPDKAEESFAEAERLAPDDPTVIETGFVRALASNNIDVADRYATRAAEQDTDRIGGLTFKGRMELARGNYRDAEATFKRAVEKNAYSPMAWRYLGQAQRLNGKPEAALASLQRAYNGRPDHRGIAEDYARLLVLNQRGAEALEVTRKLLSVTQDRTTELVDFWLNLEAEFGDRARALASRRDFFERQPGDATNSLAYLGLLLREQDFAAYDAALDKLAETDTFNSLQISSFRARAMAEQGLVEDARALLEREIAAQESPTVESYMVLGRFEREFGDMDRAIAAYERGRPLQDDTRLEAERSLGDLLFASAQNANNDAAQAAGRGDTAGAERLQELSQEHYRRAAESYKLIHQANTSDTDVSKRYAETLIKLDRLIDAERVLDKVENPDDLQVLLLRSIIANINGQARDARALLDRAVELNPNDPLPYFRRAELNRSEAALFPDVIADLDQVNKLRPSFIEAWTLRFALYQQRGQLDEAFAQLTSAIDANPDNDMLKVMHVNLLRANGRSEQATVAAQKYANAQWDDPEWLERAAVLSYQRAKYDEATRYYKRLYELNETPLAAADLLNAWFRADEDPPLPEVNRLRRKVAEVEETSPERAVVKKMLEARAEEWLGNKTEANKLSIEAYQIAQEAGAKAVAFWFEDLRLRFKTDEKPGMDEAFAFLKSKGDELGTLPPILQIFVIRNDRINNVPADQCLERLNALAIGPETDPTTKLEFHRLQNQLYYTLGEYEKCAEACRAGLAIDANTARDLELNNNLAYTLAKHLNDPEAALPYAQRASEVAPWNAAVLDTEGWVYFMSGRFRDADRVLQRAITIATGPDELVPAYLHLAQSKKATGDAQEARKNILRASEELKKASDTIKDQYAQEVKALFDELN